MDKIDKMEMKDLFCKKSMLFNTLSKPYIDMLDKEYTLALCEQYPILYSYVFSLRYAIYHCFDTRYMSFEYMDNIMCNVPKNVVNEILVRMIYHNFDTSVELLIKKYCEDYDDLFVTFIKFGRRYIYIKESDIVNVFNFMNNSKVNIDAYKDIILDYIIGKVDTIENIACINFTQEQIEFYNNYLLYNEGSINYFAVKPCSDFSTLYLINNYKNIPNNIVPNDILHAYNIRDMVYINKHKHKHIPNYECINNAFKLNLPLKNDGEYEHVILKRNIHYIHTFKLSDKVYDLSMNIQMNNILKNIINVNCAEMELEQFCKHIILTNDVSGEYDMLYKKYKIEDMMEYYYIINDNNTERYTHIGHNDYVWMKLGDLIHFILDNYL